MELYSVFFDLKAYQNQQNNYVVTSVVAVIVVRTAKKIVNFSQRDLPIQSTRKVIQI